MFVCIRNENIKKNSKKNITRLDQNDIETGAALEEFVEPTRRHDSFAVIDAILHNDQELVQISAAHHLLERKVFEHRHRTQQTKVGVNTVARARVSLTSLTLLLLRSLWKMTDHGHVVTVVDQCVGHGAEHVKMTFAAERKNRQYVVAVRGTKHVDERQENGRHDHGPFHREIVCWSHGRYTVNEKQTLKRLLLHLQLYPLQMESATYSNSY